MKLRLILLAVALSFLTTAGSCAPPSPAVTASWDAPTTGSPVEYYTLEIYEEGLLWAIFETPETEYLIPAGQMTAGKVYTAHVRGTDAQGRAGPWSEWSDGYVWDLGAPGSCGSVKWGVTQGED